MRTSILGVFLLLCLIFDAMAEDLAPIPNGMGVLGDSISEAMLSEYSIEVPPNFGELLGMVATATLGDPAKRLLNFRTKYAKKEHAWFSGEQMNDMITSHAERLKAVNPSLIVHNFAVSGSKTDALYDQVSELLDFEAQNQTLMDYLAILIGANDLKEDKLEFVTDPDTFGLRIKRALYRVLEKNPHRMILMVGIPKIHKIFEESQNIVGYEILGFNIKCDSIRRNIYGDAVIFDPSNPEYNATKFLFYMYQEAIEKVARELREAFPAARIRTVQNYDALAALYKTLSVDCFHPSEWGQALLAEITWNYSFWPQLDVKDPLFDE